MRKKLFHTSSCKHLENILEKAGVEPRHCKVFNKELVYLFFNSPEYRLYKKYEADGPNLLISEHEELLPFVIMIEEGSVHKPDIHVTDTGFHKKLKETHSELPSVQKFKLEQKDVEKFIQDIFGSSQNYINGLKSGPKRISKFRALSDNQEKIRELSPLTDARNSALEYKVSHSIDVKHFIWIIVPFDFADSIKDLGENCKVITYGYVSSGAASEAHGGLGGKFIEKAIEEAWWD